MIATPLLALFLDYRLAIAMSAIPLLIMAASWLATNVCSRAALGDQVRLLPGVALGAAFGAALQVSLPERLSILLLALLLASSVVMPWLADRWATVTVASARRRAPWFGLMAGITESALNAGAPFMVLYGSMARLKRFQQLLALNVCFALGKTIQISLMALHWPPSASFSSLAAGVAASLSTYWAGDRLAGRYPQAQFQRLFRSFVFCMVFTLLIRAALY